MGGDHLGTGISGMGRIGRLLVRRMFAENEPAVKLSAINSIYPAETVAHLLRYDSVHGKWDADVKVDGGDLVINGHYIKVVCERDPRNIPWRELGVKLVLDSTGKFNNREGARQHFEAGASQVIITAPGKDMDITIVMGVNDRLFDPGLHKLLSTASCTTNCLSPVLAVLDQSLQIKRGWVTTVHAFTSDQNHLDNPHQDLRRARACTQSIVPTTTGAGKALKDVLPHLAPHIHGMSLRVPTQDVSVIDLTVTLSRETSGEEIKSIFRKAASGEFAPYLAYSEEPLVSIDYTGSSKSAVIDGLSIMASGHEAKILAWYDNEWGYACRVVELAGLVETKIAGIRETEPVHAH
ncbi:type I glyceraldehyde-3-phosphate dehydrogenase [Paenibacillus tarimensis]